MDHAILHGKPFGIPLKILEPQASVFLRFPKVEQHLKCMDHAILLVKPFGDCFIK
jgi:hypothetical protein